MHTRMTLAVAGLLAATGCGLAIRPGDSWGVTTRKVALRIPIAMVSLGTSEIIYAAEEAKLRGEVFVPPSGPVFVPPYPYGTSERRCTTTCWRLVNGMVRCMERCR
jgi:hypothetical protein